MKGKVLTLMLLLAAALTGAAQQNMACFGWKNPFNFTLYTDSLTGKYTGQHGIKLNRPCTDCFSDTAGMDWIDVNHYDDTCRVTADGTFRNVYPCTFSSPSNLGARYYNELYPYQFSPDRMETATTMALGESVSYFCRHHGDRMLGDTLIWRVMWANEGPGTGANQGKDPLTGYALPYCPPGYDRSIRIGQCRMGREADKLNYTFRVSNYSKLLTIWYAIVVQAPGHGYRYDPVFKIRITRLNANGEWQVPSDTLCYVVPSTPASMPGGSLVIGQDGWHSLRDTTYRFTGAPPTVYDVYYRDWNKAVVDLSKYNYQMVRVEITISDCVYADGHFGYCYIAGDCQPITLESGGCASGASDTVGTAHATPGLSGYEWYYSHVGVVNGTERNNPDNFTLIDEAHDSVVYLRESHFVTADGTPLQRNTIKCVMISYINPSKPIRTPVYTEATNYKPTLRLDTTLTCDNGILLEDHSFSPFDLDGSNAVDTSRTEWTFYDTPAPMAGHEVNRDTGYVGQCHYPAPGRYCATVRTVNNDTTCWNLKTVPIRVMESPSAGMVLSDNDVCRGTTLTLTDTTEGAVFRRWTFHLAAGDSVVEGYSPSVDFTFDETTPVTLESRTAEVFLKDTNGDAVLDSFFCYGVADAVVRLIRYPVLTFAGDTVACVGRQSSISVSADLPGCRFDWYNVLFGTVPLQANSATLAFTADRERLFYVKTTSTSGCEQWDSVRVRVAAPQVWVARPRICTGDTVQLWAGQGLAQSWSASPADPSLSGQTTADTISVMPVRTTTYKVTARGSGGCTAEASATITVIPYPVMGVELKPDYIDIELPSVHFSDVSEYGASSLWDFGDGTTATARSIVHTYSDFSSDSLEVSLRTGNELGCCSDTSFWLQVSKFALWFPNAITPDLGTNREFRVFTANRLYDYELYIYDRGGDLVFSTTDAEQAWDGTRNGEKCKQGTYVWLVRYAKVPNGNLFVRKGTVTLIR